MHRSPGSSGAEPGWIRGGHIGKGGIHWKISASIIPNIIWGWVKNGQNLVPLVKIKIAGKWMFIPLKMVLIGIDPYPSIIPNII